MNHLVVTTGLLSQDLAGDSGTGWCEAGKKYPMQGMREAGFVRLAADATLSLRFWPCLPDCLSPKMNVLPVICLNGFRQMYLQVLIYCI